VDDDAGNRTLLYVSLRLAGIDAIEAEDGWQGLERALSEEPNLVVLDVDMPGLDGFELATKLREDERTSSIPVLFVTAAAARGTTTIRGAAELRVKESDRIATMAAGLRELGITITETSDGAVIEGGALRGGEVDSVGDHRVAMSFGVAGAIAAEPIRISGCEAVATSFPGFLDLANRAGLAIGAMT